MCSSDLAKELMLDKEDNVMSYVFLISEINYVVMDPLTC